MIKFYFNAAPNPVKIALLLEELGLAYETIPVDTRKGQQHDPAFTRINPNAKVPAIADGDAVVFDSNAILLYLADKEQRFVPAINSHAERGEMLSWLLFIASGIGPYSGQAVHFRVSAPEPKEYALNRYDFEAHRHWKILDERLATRHYLLGENYSIVDMAFWGWARMVPLVLGGEDAWLKLPNVKRLLDEISQRPAAPRAEALRTSFQWKTEMDDEARRAMFPHNERLKKPV
ncbi:MAG: glutathione S-transferase family protein [Limnohabitans sp.]|nr:glutathione S-transferase family protein [Limnohabitans sp.]